MPTLKGFLLPDLTLPVQSQTRKTKFHEPLVQAQCKRMWWIVSSSSVQRKHQSTKDHPLLCNWSKFKIFPQEASHAKKIYFSWDHRVPNCHHRNAFTLSCPEKYRRIWLKFTCLSSLALLAALPWSLKGKTPSLYISQSSRFLENESSYTLCCPADPKTSIT